jgi:hypothetical protein
MRDVARRRGMVRVVADFASRRGSTAVSNGPMRAEVALRPRPADAQGQLLVPAIALHFLVPGLRAQVPDARIKLIDYLAANFHEIVYI